MNNYIFCWIIYEKQIQRVNIYITKLGCNAGYGDIVPFTSVERLFDIVAMLIGALVFGYIIGAVGNVVQQRSAKENEFFTAMQNLDGFMQVHTNK